MKKSSGIAAVVVLVLVVFIALTGCEASQPDLDLSTARESSDNKSSPTATHYLVSYHAETDGADFEVQFTNDSNGTDSLRQSHAKYYESASPFDKTLSLESGQYVSLTAQTDGAGSVSCKIHVDGNLWRSSTSHGRYAVAMCSGVLGSK